MSRRIAYLFAFAACATVAAPAIADPECFDGVCRMPEVMETHEPAPVAPSPAAVPATPSPEVFNAIAAPYPQTAAPRLGPAPEPIRPQMRVDDVPRPAWRPLPTKPPEQTVEKPADKIEKPVRQAIRPAPRAPEVAEEPVELVSRRYVPTEQPQQTYAVRATSVPPSAGVVVVAPGAQYGEDGVVVANGRQDASWQLCQVDRPGPGHDRCIQYNYQPYGAYGYRPLGTYKAYKTSPSYVYVPDAKVISLD